MGSPGSPTPFLGSPSLFLLQAVVQPTWLSNAETRTAIVRDYERTDPSRQGDHLQISSEHPLATPPPFLMPKYTLIGHTDEVTSAESFIDEAGHVFYVSGSKDGTVRVWEHQGTELIQLIGHHSAVTSVCPVRVHGQWHILSGSIGGSVRLWDLKLNADGRPERYVQDTPVFNIPASVQCLCAIETPESEVPVFAVGGEADGRINLLNEKGQVIGHLTGHHGYVRILKPFYRQGHPYLVSAGSDGTIRLWDIDRGTEVQQWGAPPENVTALDSFVIGENDYLLSGSFDGSVRVWPLPASFGQTRQIQTPIMHLEGRPTRVNAITAFSLHEHPYAISAGADGSLTLWDLEKGMPLEYQNGYPEIESLKVISRSGVLYVVTGHAKRGKKGDPNANALNIFQLNGALVDTFSLGSPANVAEPDSAHVFRSWEHADIVHRITGYGLSLHPLGFIGGGNFGQVYVVTDPQRPDSLPMAMKAGRGDVNRILTHINFSLSDQSDPHWERLSIGISAQDDDNITKTVQKALELERLGLNGSYDGGFFPHIYGYAIENGDTHRFVRIYGGPFHALDPGTKATAFLMEYIDGKPLQQALLDGSLRLGQVAELYGQMAEALHQKGQFLWDAKVENFKVVQRGDHLRLIYIDHAGIIDTKDLSERIIARQNQGNVRRILTCALVAAGVDHHRAEEILQSLQPEDLDVDEPLVDVVEPTSHGLPRIIGRLDQSVVTQTGLWSRHTNVIPIICRRDETTAGHPETYLLLRLRDPHERLYPGDLTIPGGRNRSGANAEITAMSVTANSLELYHPPRGHMIRIGAEDAFAYAYDKVNQIRTLFAYIIPQEELGEIRGGYHLVPIGDVLNARHDKSGRYLIIGGKKRRLTPDLLQPLIDNKQSHEGLRCLQQTLEKFPSLVLLRTLEEDPFGNSFLVQEGDRREVFTIASSEDLEILMRQRREITQRVKIQNHVPGNPHIPQIYTLYDAGGHSVSDASPRNIAALSREWIEGDNLESALARFPVLLDSLKGQVDELDQQLRAAGLILAYPHLRHFRVRKSDGQLYINDVSVLRELPGQDQEEQMAKAEADADVHLHILKHEMDIAAGRVPLDPPQGESPRDSIFEIGSGPVYGKVSVATEKGIGKGEYNLDAYAIFLGLPDQQGDFLALLDAHKDASVLNAILDHIRETLFSLISLYKYAGRFLNRLIQCLSEWANALDQDQAGTTLSIVRIRQNKKGKLVCDIRELADSAVLILSKDPKSRPRYISPQYRDNRTRSSGNIFGLGQLTFRRLRLEMGARTSVPLQPGDRIILVTDGGINNQRHMLTSWLHQVHVFIEKVYEHEGNPRDLIQYARSILQSDDDITVISYEVQDPAPQHTGRNGLIAAA